MKKFMGITLILTMVLILLIPVSAATNIEVTQVSDIKIDGVKDTGYGSDSIPIKEYKTDGMNGGTAEMWTAWNNNTLYVYIEVKDTTPNHENDATYARDSVEFFFDFDNEKGPDGKNNGKPYWQIRIASNPNADDIQITGRVQYEAFTGTADSNCTEAVGQKISDYVTFTVVPLSGNDLSKGYIIEAAFKLDGITTLSTGKIIGFDVQINDNQDGSGRTSQAFVEKSDTNDTQNNNPTACNGLLTLAAAIEVETVAAAEPIAINDSAPVTSTPDTTPTSVQTSDMTLIFSIVTLMTSSAVLLVSKKRK